MAIEAKGLPNPNHAFMRRESHKAGGK